MSSNTPENTFILCRAGPPMKRYETPALTLESSIPKSTPKELENLAKAFNEAMEGDLKRLDAAGTPTQNSNLTLTHGSPACSINGSIGSSSNASAQKAGPSFSFSFNSDGYSDSDELAIRSSSNTSGTPLGTSVSFSFSVSSDGYSNDEDLPPIQTIVGNNGNTKSSSPQNPPTGTSSISMSAPSSQVPLSQSAAQEEPKKALSNSDVLPAQSGSGKKKEHMPIGKRWEEAVKDMIISGMKGDASRWEKNKAMMKILEITNEFRETAVTYMRTIISEKLRPEENRTITTKEVKGQAGGQKFIVGNEYFFKLPVKKADGKLQYPSYDASAKVAGHEIKACTHFFNEITNPGIYKKIKGLVPKDLNTATDAELSALRNSIIVPPLMVLIDYLGFRAIAMCTFNLDNANTLIGGSADGGDIMVDKLDLNTKQLLDLVNYFERNITHNSHNLIDSSVHSLIISSFIIFIYYLFIHFILLFVFC